MLILNVWAYSGHVHDRKGIGVRSKTSALPAGGECDREGVWSKAEDTTCGIKRIFNRVRVSEEEFIEFNMR